MPCPVATLRSSCSQMPKCIGPVSNKAKIIAVVATVALAALVKFASYQTLAITGVVGLVGIVAFIIYDHNLVGKRTIV